MTHSQNCPSCGATVETYKNPFPTADTVVIRDGKILLIERLNPPSGWALPGGFVDYGKTVETCAARELKEETGLTAESLELLGVYSDPKRDPRFHTIGTVFLCKASGTPTAGDDARAVQWFPLSELPEEIAFDHRKIIADAIARLESRRV